MASIASWVPVKSGLPVPMIGRSLEPLRARIPSLAASRETLIIWGEQGTGKSLFASHVCNGGDHAGAPSFSLNCATSSERDQKLGLFGSEFVSLTTTRRGVLEYQLTLVVKHINRASRVVQEDLGRAMMVGSFRRLGSLKSQPVQARVILTLRESPEALASHSLIAPSLAALLRSARAIHLPPLRERGEDSLEITRNVLGHPVYPHLRRVILGYSWPHNVAELRAYLFLSQPLPLAGPRRNAAFGELARAFLRIEEGSEISLREALDAIQSALVGHALRASGGDHRQAARILGLTERTVRWHRSRSGARD